MASTQFDAHQAEIAARQTTVAFDVERDLIVAEGTEAASYLQGQISQDVEALEVGRAAWSFVLQPQGKVDGWFRITRRDVDRFELDLDAGHGEQVMARLERFKLRTAVDFALSTAPMVAVRGPASAGPAGVVALPLPSSAEEGFDLLGDDIQAAADVARGPAEVLETLRVRSGVPAMGRELTDKTIPAEAGVVEQSVSFTKGCYVGQELVARVDSRGNNTPRNLFGLKLGDPSREVLAALGEADVQVGGETVGQITSAAFSNELGPVALVYLRRGTEVPAPAQVRLDEATALDAELMTLPF